MSPQKYFGLDPEGYSSFSQSHARILKGRLANRLIETLGYAMLPCDFPQSSVNGTNLCNGNTVPLLSASVFLKQLTLAEISIQSNSHPFQLQGQLTLAEISIQSSSHSSDLHVHSSVNVCVYSIYLSSISI